MESAPGIQTTADTGSSQQKETALRGMMRELKSVLVAYSGGVDSAYLALIATQELGNDAVCIMGISPSVSAFQRKEAENIANTFEFKVETIDTQELSDPNYTANPSNRCYFCKSELYEKLAALKHDRQLATIVDGTNADDLLDHRPGRTAASEYEVRSPLAEIGFTKNEIRERSKAHGLPSWDKPSSPCLASRVAYGVPVTIARLGKVERGEEILREAGLSEFRVRVHGDLVRLEISAGDFEGVLNTDTTERFSQAFRELGFRYVTLDLTGFRSGSMNEPLNSRNNILEK